MVRELLLRAGGRIRSLLNRAFYRQAGGDDRPVFFDVDATRPELRALEENFDVVREELDKALELRTRIPRYHEANAAQTYISGSDELAWRVLYVHTRRGKLPTSGICPRTTALVRRVPGVQGAFFSILEAGKSVPAHRGPYLGYLRYHLAMKVPAVDPPSIRIKDQIRTWKEREGFIFDDSHEHQVYNESKDIRVVLIVDIFRPMPWYLHWPNAAWEPFKALIGAHAPIERLKLKEKAEAGA